MAGIPFFELSDPIDIGIELQWFGIIVATGVLIGASLARRYGDRHGVDDDDMRGMTAWVVVSGFLGAHLFDALVYEWDETQRDYWRIVKLWQGISSYGGFVGGAIGWWFYQWWKRLETGLWADITVVGLLPAFSIGRIGCTVVHDHIGAPTSSFIGVDYPRAEIYGRLCTDPKGRPDDCPEFLHDLLRSSEETIRAHNLGMNELFYLIPVNVLVLWLAFRNKKTPAGMLAVLTGLFYAPVRFFIEYWRPDTSDPRYIGLTFAQWCSLLAFAGAAWGLVYLRKHGKAAPLVEELGPKEIGGRKDRRPRLSAKEIAAAERETRRQEVEKREAEKKKMMGKGAGSKKEKEKKKEPAAEKPPEEKPPEEKLPEATAEADDQADKKADKPPADA